MLPFGATQRHFQAKSKKKRDLGGDQVSQAFLAHPLTLWGCSHAQRTTKRNMFPAHQFCSL